MNKKAVFLNMFSNLMSFAIQIGISFFLTPYIISNLSAEAYGFISLANTFPSYAQLITAALNGMASRFISIEIFKKNYDEANRYFSSVVISNIILSGAWLVFTAGFVPNINSFLNVSPNLVHDVKILFAIIFLNFALSLLTNLLTIAVYTENKLYLNSFRSIEGLILKSVLLVVLFVFFEPKVYYIAIGASAELIFTIVYNLYYTRKFLPFIKVRKAFFEIKKVGTLISSGIWNCVSRLGGILNQGLDLLICNLFIGPADMGVLSIAKTIPAMILTMINIIAGSFSPDITKNYATKSTKEVSITIKQSMKVMGALISIPLGGLVAFGSEFFTLWVPTEDPKKLQILSILSLLLLFFTAATATVYNVFTVTNKLKLNSIVTVICGLINTAIIFILIKTTNLGIFAIASVSSFVGIFRDYLFTLPYAAKCLNIKWYSFYFPAFKTVISVAAVWLVCSAYKFLFPVDSWFMLILAAAVCSVISLVFNFFIAMNKDERKYLISKIKNK